MPDILAATSDEQFEDRLRAAFLGMLNGELESVGDLNVDRLLDADPLVISLGPGFSDDELIAAVGEIDRQRPEIPVVLVGDPTPELWERALRAGARDLVATDAGPEMLHDSFERALERSNRQRDNMRSGFDVSEVDAPAGSRSRVVVVVSPKGGSGKTMLATNLAYGLADHAASDVVLVDLDLQFGDITTALRLNAEYNMSHAASRGIDVVQLKAFLTAHPAGFWALPAPPDPAAADLLTADTVRHVLATLAGEFSWMIVDTGAGLDDHTLTALEMATDVLLLTTTDVASIQSVRKTVDILDQLGMNKSTQTVVLNRANARVGLAIEDIERTIGREVQVRIPSHRVVPTAMNQGAPVLEDNARSSVGRGIQSVVDDLVGRDKNQDSSVLKSLFRGGRQ